MTIWQATHRPEDEKIRAQVDLGYTIEKQQIFLKEIRPVYLKKGEFGHYPFAKISYEKSSDSWKIYWMRGNLQWTRYKPTSKINDLEDALNEIMNDPMGCFFG